MNGIALLELSRALAVVMHEGQCRKGTGEPYYEHVRRVEAAVQGWRRKTIANLHDLVEDTGITFRDLAHLRFPGDVIDDVAALTKQEGEVYREFILRAKRGGDDVVAVKLADVRDNLRDLEYLPGDYSSLRMRYVSAEALLLDEGVNA